ncbi:MAG TPA: cation diffusion facilitator family transporter [Flavipsychrobacter sp.]|nr:cation diffusion facilitator family transporter [Flavipsychrobacter sp.]
MIVLLSVVLFLGKIAAWYLTRSVAILTDALESIVNVVAGFIGLYSVILAAKPRDRNHPFGHGKVEYISAAIEGSLIFIAGLVILYEAGVKLVHPQKIHKLDVGIVITLLTGIINYFAGSYAIREGVKHKSATIETAGKHVRVDAYSTFAIILGLLLIRFTKWQWLDSAVALVFAMFILITGYRVVRKSLSGIMDETDETIVNEVIQFIQHHRRPQWIDMHNLRVLQFGDVLHIDAHMTMPWYYTVKDGEKEIHIVEDLIKEHFGGKVEIFIHIDACASFSCKLCCMENCPVREAPFQELEVWNTANVWEDAKHGKTGFDHASTIN